jgi:hypothetical protein
MCNGCLQRRCTEINVFRGYGLLALLDSRDLAAHARTRMASGKTKSSLKEVQLALRVPEALMEAIDGEVGRLRAERPGARINRSDAVREILFQVLLSNPEYAVESAKRRRSARREHDE